MLDLLKQRMLAMPHRASAIGAEPRQAAVLMAITDSLSSPKVILTRRSSQLPVHRGEVSLPGGKWEQGDDSLMATALRESHEEIGLDPAVVEVFTSLPSSSTGFGFNVSPYIGIVPEGVNLEMNPREIESIFQVPLQYFLDDPRVRTDVFRSYGEKVWSPVYEFDGFKIWGFTARVITHVVNEFLDAGLSIEHTAPVKVWK